MGENDYMNPYYGLTFFNILLEFVSRFFQLMIGKLNYNQLVSDEIQLIVLVGVAFSSALVGSFLILKRMAMLANSLSHTILLGIVAAYFVGQVGLVEYAHESFSLNIPLMMLTSVIMGVITTFLTEFFTKKVNIQEDASTGIVFTTLFAIGIVAVTMLTRNAHIGTEVVMGNVDALIPEDSLMIFIILGINLLLSTLFFKEYKITTFDSAYAKALGFSSVLFNYLLMIQVSLTVIGAFRAVGVLMVLSFLTGPPLIARLLTHNLKTMIVLSCVIGSFASLMGVTLSRHLLSEQGIALSTGGLVTCVISFLFILAVFFKFYQGNNKGLSVTNH